MELKRTHANKKPKLVGRGSKRGKTAGRGTKGQKARAGHSIRPAIRDMIKKYPKLRGRGKNSNKSIQVAPTTVNIGAIAAVFSKDAAITPATLLAKKLIRRTGGTLPKVKILGSGEISYAVICYDCEVTASAQAKIEAAGGSVK